MSSQDTVTLQPSVQAVGMTRAGDGEGGEGTSFQATRAVWSFEAEVAGGGGGSAATAERVWISAYIAGTPTDPGNLVGRGGRVKRSTKQMRRAKAAAEAGGAERGSKRAALSPEDHDSGARRAGNVLNSSAGVEGRVDGGADDFTSWPRVVPRPRPPPEAPAAVELEREITYLQARARSDL